MSDFISDFWSHYITVIVFLGIGGLIWLLIFAGFKKVKSADDGSTGHVWDEDLRELNNPLPMWWVGLFVGTIVFALGYLYYYPGLGTYKGSSQWTSGSEYQKDKAKALQEAAPVYAAFQHKSVEELAKDPAAMDIAGRLFGNNCALCHGADARGSKGFPNLTDTDWLYGGKSENIVESITNGRIGVMPSFTEAVGSPDDARNLANYVLSLSNSPHDSVRAQLGKGKFVVCAACHGADGKGNPLMGAPNLTDNIWLHGYGEDFIVGMINHGKTNQMPEQKGRYDATQIKMLAAYVWGYSNGGVSAQHMP